jgi:hypothetical protein
MVMLGADGNAVDVDVLQIVGQVAGIGGAALGAVGIRLPRSRPDFASSQNFISDSVDVKKIRHPKESVGAGQVGNVQKHVVKPTDDCKRVIAPFPARWRFGGCGSKKTERPASSHRSH